MFNILYVLYVGRQNYLELNIYFQELNCHVIEEKPVYDSASLWGMCIGEFQTIYGDYRLKTIECIRATVNSLFTDTTISRTPGVDPCCFSIIFSVT